MTFLPRGLRQPNSGRTLNDPVPAPSEEEFYQVDRNLSPLRVTTITVPDERKGVPFCCTGLILDRRTGDVRADRLRTENDDGPEVGVTVGRTGVQKVSPAALRRQRHRRKLSLRQLSLLSGVGAATISAWEGGRRAPSARLLAAVAVALDVSVADLVPVPERRVLLVDLRHQAGLSQRAAAGIAGLSPSMYQAIESGFRAADPRQRTTLAAQLGVTEGDFAETWRRTRQAYLSRNITR